VTVKMSYRILVPILLGRQRPAGRESGPFVVVTWEDDCFEDTLDRPSALMRVAIFQCLRFLRVKDK